jgi:hypothetical protein
MTIALVILGIVAFIIYRFSSDQNKIVKNNINNGGLINKHKTFVQYCDNPLSSTRMELVTNNGSTLEYRIPIKKDNKLKGYIHFGLKDTFTVIIFCNAVSVNGFNHKGFIKELPNWKNIKYDDYDKILSSMISSMTSTHEFKNLDFD